MSLYHNARTDVEHVDRSFALRWRSLSYIRGGIAAVGLNVSWDAIREVRGRVVEVEYTETPGGEIYNYSFKHYTDTRDTLRDFREKNCRAIPLSSGTYQKC